MISFDLPKKEFSDDYGLQFALPNEHFIVLPSHQKAALSYVAGRKANDDYVKIGAIRNTSPEKAETDDRVGKFAEFAISSWLESITGLLILPDTNVYQATAKSFDPDLPNVPWDKPSIVHFHVKATDRIIGTNENDHLLFHDLFNYSNNNGRGGQDTLFKLSQKELRLHYGAFVFMDKETEVNGVLLAIVRMDVVRPLLELPKVKKLQEIKRCFYLKTLLKHYDIYQPKVDQD